MEGDENNKHLSDLELEAISGLFFVYFQAFLLFVAFSGI